MKKFTIFVITLALFVLLSGKQGVEAGPDYLYFASKSGQVEQEDFAPVELSFTNNTLVPITIGDIDVQRVMLPFVEGTMETIAQIPSATLDACRSVVGATEANPTPDGECINIDGEWYRNTLDENRDDVLPKPTIAPGETAVIAEISTGMPASWRGWYGGGWVDLFAWIEITPEGGDKIVWEGGFVRHFISLGEAGPEVEFLQDNGDGSATFIITGLQSGLKKENFEVYQRIDDKFAGYIGIIVSVTEEDGAYVLIWRHVVQNHNGVVIAAHDDEGNNVLDWGDLPVITITSSAIPREFTTADGRKVTSNIDDIKDLANTEIDLIFTAVGAGSISFAPGLNLFDHKDELMQLANFLSVTYDESKNEMKASVDTKALTFLANHGATIQFFDVSEKMGIDELTEANFKELLDIVVYDDDKLVEDISDYFDWDKVKYDAENDILTLPVNHFTEYVLGEATEEELPETGAAIIGGVTLGILSLGGYALYKRKKKI